MIQFKRLTSESTSTIDNVTLKSGQPAIDLKDKTLYVGSTEAETASTSKLKFYDSNHVDNKLVNKVTVKKSSTSESYIYPTTGNITFIQGSNVTLTPDTTNKTITIASSYSNTAHSHKAGDGLNIDGSGGTSGTVTYSLKTATADEIGGIKIGYTTSGKNYAVQLDSGKAYVNVPWSNTNTSHSHSYGVGIIGSGNASTTGGTYTYKAALVDETLDTNASVSRPTANANRTYPVIADKNGKLATIVPWTDTTYSLPSASASIRGGVIYNNRYGIYSGQTSDSFCVSYLCNDNIVSNDHAVVIKTSSTVPKISNFTDYDSNYSVYPTTDGTYLGSSNYPYNKLFVQDVYLVNSWNAATVNVAGLTSLKDSLADINSRLDSLGFNGGQSVTVSGIGSSDFTLTLYKQGNVVWCNQDISSTTYVYNKRKSTTQLPIAYRPSSSVTGSIVGYNVSGSYKTGFSSKITIDSSGYITLETNSSITIASSTGYYMNYICFAYKLS